MQNPGRFSTHPVHRDRRGSEPQVLHRDHWCFDFFPFPRDVDVEVGAYALGYIDGGRSPMTLLHDDGQPQVQSFALS